MSESTDYPYRHHHPDTLERLRSWLFARPAESWLFFAAGIIVGVIVH